jgi:FACT complex subunit (SPT16/CDC68)
VLLQGRAYTLPDVWIRPPLGGKGRKMTGQLEAHANGFRYLGPKGEVLDIMYRYAFHPVHHSGAGMLSLSAFGRGSCTRMQRPVTNMRLSLTSFTPSV